MAVAQIMSTDLVKINMDTPLLMVRDIFQRKNIHHLLVVERSELVGVLSDRDLLHALSPSLGTPCESEKDLRALRRPAHQIMTRKPICLREGDSIIQASELMLESGGSCLPVVDANSQPLGIVTWRDLLRVIGPLVKRLQAA